MRSDVFRKNSARYPIIESSAVNYAARNCLNYHLINNILILNTVLREESSSTLFHVCVLFVNSSTKHASLLILLSFLSISHANVQRVSHIENFLYWFSVIMAYALQQLRCCDCVEERTSITATRITWEGESFVYTVLIKRSRPPLSFSASAPLRSRDTPGYPEKSQPATRCGPLTSSYAPDLLSLSSSFSLSPIRGSRRTGAAATGMAFRIGGLPIFSPIKIPSRLPHDGLPARHSRFKLIPTTARPREEERTRASAPWLVPCRP